MPWGECLGHRVFSRAPFLQFQGLHMADFESLARGEQSVSVGVGGSIISASPPTLAHLRRHR